MFWLAKQQLCTFITLLTTMTAISFFFLLEIALKIQLLKISLTFEKLKYMQRWSLKQREFTFWVRFSLPLPLWLLKLPIILTQLHRGYKKLAWCWKVHGCHEDMAVLDHFCAKAVTWCLYPDTKCSYRVTDKVTNRFHQGILTIINFMVICFGKTALN